MPGSKRKEESQNKISKKTIVYVGPWDRLGWTIDGKNHYFKSGVPEEVDAEIADEIVLGDNGFEYVEEITN